MTLHHGCEYAAHAALARYGVMLGEVDFATMVQDIINATAGDAPNALHLVSQPWGREVWIVRIPNGPAVRVVYEPIIAMIVTVLPPQWRINTSVPL